MEVAKITIEIHKTGLGFQSLIIGEVGDDAKFIPLPNCHSILDAAKDAVNWIKADLERGDWSRLLGDKQ